MQNTKRYWLRGGIIFAIIYLIVAVLYIPPFVIRYDLTIFPLDALNILGKYSGFHLGLLGHSAAGFPGLIIAFVIILLVYIGIGMFLGYFYGKIKNRNKI